MRYQLDKKALYRLSYGLFVLTARENEKDNGCIVNTVIQLTSEPLRISVAVNKSNLTHDMIKSTGRFNVSVLSEKSRFSTYQHWGFQSGKNTDKAENITFSRSENGIIYLTDEANAVFSAKVVSQTDLGTHTLFIADVEDCRVLSDDASVTYDFYQKNIKPAPPAAQKVSKGFICTVCGYIYEGDTLPADFICPVCKHPATDFEPLKTDNSDEKEKINMKKYVCPVCGYVHEGNEPPEKCPQCGVPGSKFIEKEDNGKLDFACEHIIGVAKSVTDSEIVEGLRANFTGECTEVGMYLAMSRAAFREGYPEIGMYYEKAALEEAEHAAKFAELLGEVVSDSTKENLYKRMLAEQGATEGKLKLAKRAKELDLDAIHDTVHEMAKDEARHGKAFEALYHRYFD